MPAYKSYCWALGTTSFRMVEFNRKIEAQLALLNDFWALPEYTNERWSENEPVQVAYYDYLLTNGFIEGQAARKAKDAREKTSGLVDMGLITDERRLTQVGQALLDISINANFSVNNMLQLPADSYIYFKQLLKVANEFDDQTVRPFAVLTYLLNQFGSISKDEFTYLLPLITSQEKAEIVTTAIRSIRESNSTIDDCILSVILPMENYQQSLDMLLNQPVSEELIKEIGMNRKSRNYDASYYSLYNALWTFYQDARDDNVATIFNAVKNISGKAKTYWKQYLFNTSSTNKILRDGVDAVNVDCRLFVSNDENEFKIEFFKLLHLFKAKSLLSDYYDLNKRYFKTTDSVLFQDNLVKLDIIPNCYFSLIGDELLNIAFRSDDKLQTNCELQEISPIFDISQEQLFAKIEELYGVQVRSLYDVHAFIDNDRYERFNAMIDEKFTDDVLIDLMTKFENRNDAEIRDIVTNNADVPTIFEYILAIAWYKISGRQGRILDYMNLSLDADLLPITHASGGHEDITYKYSATEDYPEHTLLIEATLSNSTNQRRMEMEPVSRHLGEYLLSHEEEAYCLFTTTFLHLNVVADFRGRKFMPYYSTDGQKHVEGMKIIPCQTSEIKTILQKNLNYKQLYKIFNKAYQSNLAPNIWYQEEILNKI